MHKSMLNDVQRQKWESDFVNNQFVEGNIDPQQLEEWKAMRGESSSSGTEQESSSDGEDERRLSTLIKQYKVNENSMLSQESASKSKSNYKEVADISADFGDKQLMFDEDRYRE